MERRGMEISEVYFDATKLTFRIGQDCFVNEITRKGIHKIVSFVHHPMGLDVQYNDGTIHTYPAGFRVLWTPVKVVDEKAPVDPEPADEAPKPEIPDGF